MSAIPTCPGCGSAHVYGNDEDDDALECDECGHFFFPEEDEDDVPRDGEHESALESVYGPDNDGDF